MVRTLDFILLPVAINLHFPCCACVFVTHKEHWLEMWALFIDLVKALLSVPREALIAIPRRFGLPDHFVNIVK